MPRYCSVSASAAREVTGDGNDHGPRRSHHLRDKACLRPGPQSCPTPLGVSAEVQQRWAGPEDRTDLFCIVAGTVDAVGAPAGFRSAITGSGS